MFQPRTSKSNQYHTPGQVALLLQQGTGKLLYWSDVFLHPLHMERLDWQTIFDYDQAAARRTRERYLDLAYREEILVNAFHFDFPGMGKVDKGKDAWVWRYEEV
jgi:glyoxylase-like metal-dependent hydrolase (beta-lactamase superfamily II)